MAPFPLNLTALFGPVGMALVYLAIGFAFGYVLEIAGFGSSRKLAAQFYFRDMTVLKVMFTAIVVAMVLIYGASALGWLDLNLIWVNPTYLWPGIVGGLLMGVGFIVGGFCPGTSLVSAATFKIDGVFFVLGGLFGIFLFGESVDLYSVFWHSSYLGRFTLPQLFGLPAGVVVVLVVLMALFMFWGSEQLERIFGKKDPRLAPRARYAGAAALVGLAVVVAFLGQPTTEDRWERIAPKQQAALTQRLVQISPAELLHTIHDHQLKLILLDVRREADYNLFHLADARRVEPGEVGGLVPELVLEPPNTVVVVMSNDEQAATEAWKLLIAESVVNVYILEGGINRWLDVFAGSEPAIQPAPLAAPDRLRYTFDAALGAAYPIAFPDPHDWELEYSPKIQLQIKRGPMGGGCG